MLREPQWFRVLAGCLMLGAAMQPSTASANPAPLQYGAISRAQGSPYLVDRLNDRTWLGWDATRGLTYAETQEATLAGGRFAGFKIAELSDALALGDALFNVGACGQKTWPTYYVCHEGPRSGLEDILGESYFGPDAWLNRQDNDYAIFSWSNGSDIGFGMIETGTLYYTDYEILDIYQVAVPFSEAGRLARESNIGWLLYRDGTMRDLPEPNSLPLAAGALFAFAACRRRKAARQGQI